MAGIQVLLDEAQANDLRQFIYQMTNEAVRNAIQDAGANKEFLNQKELSEYLGCSINTLKSYVREGLPIIVMGGRNYYSKTEVTKFMLSRQRGGLNA